MLALSLGHNFLCYNYCCGFCFFLIIVIIIIIISRDFSLQNDKAATEHSAS